MTDRLADRAWPSLDRSSPGRTSPDGGAAWLLVPVGSVEQHGPHLPLTTDTVIASAVAERVASRLAGRSVGRPTGRSAGQPAGTGRAVTVGPAVEYGASGEHQDFPGTVSVGHEALRLLLLELGRSATTWAERLVLVNGHGGNVEALGAAVTTLRAEGREVGWTSCGVPGGDAHAGDAETSMLLALAPHLVGEHRAPGEVRPVTQLMDDLRERGVRAVSGSGVLGDPTTATAERGRRLVETLVERVVGEVSRMAPDERGRLR